MKIWKHSIAITQEIWSTTKYESREREGNFVVVWERFFVSQSCVFGFSVTKRSNCKTYGPTLILDFASLYVSTDTFFDAAHSINEKKKKKS